MQNSPVFVTLFEKEAKALLQTNAIGEPLFSRGTYQFEVKEQKKGTFFPFLQISAEGVVSDAFCTCKTSERGNGCPHLAAAFLRIYNGHPEPLHVRFKSSLWNRLCQMAGKRHGYEPDCLSKDEEGNYFLESQTKKRLLTIQALTPAAKEKLLQMIEKREVETEETSIKFSNLTSEEISQFRAGNASNWLRFELSFWSDLAKWLMLLEESGDYEISFAGEAGHLPREMTVQFPELFIWAYISEVNWPFLIPSIAKVKSPLKVVDEENQGIENIEYIPSSRSIVIHMRGKGGDFIGMQGIVVGDWLYVEGEGFYRRRSDPLFQEGVVPPEQVAEILARSSKVLQKFLTIHPDPTPTHYRLFFDAEYNLHIETYVKEVGDLSGEGALFPPYAYVPGKGFFKLVDLMFEEKEKVIPKAEVSEFVNRHRLWLHQFPGFQTHLGSLEAHLTYTLTPDDQLIFEAHLDFPEQFDESVDLQEWVYIKNSGFYMKASSRGRLPLHPGLTLNKEEIPQFLTSHKEELEQVHDFFASSPIVSRIGLRIGLNEEGLIFTSPEIEYAPFIDPKEVRLFGDFVYLPDKGFAEMPPAARLPERYRTPVVISSAQEASFLAYELESLKPFILELDPRLTKPQHLQLKIRKIQRDRKRRVGEWLVDFIYESEFGVVDPFSIWDALNGRKKHLFSAAGCLSLKDSRFNWLRGIGRQRLDRKRGMFRLSTLEWIKLSVFEEIHTPRGPDPDSVETRQLLEELQRFETHRLFDTSRLKAKLRPYQEIGLQWLWFLYCHGLSGLLCDDMGLGKTHQTMALLAAVVHEDKERANKYLVVCPTSVIYHWQELLQKFLPELRVLTYYGLARSLDFFEEHYDLLLTSYGILRTGRDDFRTHTFEVAIFDEIQVAKNNASQTHLALKAIRAKMRLGLTGTPIENRVQEIRSILELVLPGYMPNEASFRELFVAPIEKFQDPTQKMLLSKLIKPFILRRKKSEVLFDLPEKIEEIAYCDLSHEQKKLYTETAQTLRNTVFAEIRDPSKPLSYVHVFSALSKLKQICDHPALLSENIKKFAEHQSGKWDLFVELLQEARDSGQKVVIFSQYLDMLGIIELYLKKKGIGFATIKGSTRDRSHQLRRFREDPACEVFTASLLAAGVGIDLTVASIVIHYDRWWNPAKENQATDRVHRIGQNRGVQVFKLVTKRTIEEHIHNLIERKKGLMEEIIGQDEADTINYLSREELIQVFETMFKEIE
jgi:superfamily II DNA or RNA helicase